MELPYAPAISLLGSYPKTLKAVFQRQSHNHVCSSPLRNTREVEITDEWIIDKLMSGHVVSTYSRILFSLKKEGNPINML
jgi:hypothetical protein